MPSPNLSARYAIKRFPPKYTSDTIISVSVLPREIPRDTSLLSITYSASRLKPSVSRLCAVPSYSASPSKTHVGMPFALLARVVAYNVLAGMGHFMDDVLGVGVVMTKTQLTE